MRCIVALGLLSLAPSALAQVTPIWQFAYKAPGEEFHRPTSAAPTPDGGVVTLTTTSESFGDDSVTIAVAKFSEDGDRAWSYIRTAHQCGQCLLVSWPTLDVDSAGNTYLAFRNNGASRLVKLGPDGALLWNVQITSPNHSTFVATFVAVTSDDEPIIGGTRDTGLYPFPIVFRYDANGNQVWESSPNSNTEVVGIAIGPNDEVALYGRDDYPSFAPLYFGRVFVHDPGGALRWERELSSDGYVTLNFGTFWGDTIEDVAFDSQGHLHAIVNGSFGDETYDPDNVGFAIARFDTTGSRIYRTGVESDRRTWGRRIAVDDQQNAYVIGEETNSPSSSETKTSLWRFDPTGAVDWQQRDPLAQNGRVRGRGVAVTTDGDVLVTARNETESTGISLLFDDTGAVLWQDLHPNEESASSYFFSDTRDSVVPDANGHLYTVRATGARTVVNKLAPGGPIGASYCGPAVVNSTGAPGVIEAVGFDGAADNNVSLLMRDLPGGTFAMVVTSTTQGFVAMPGGSQGNLCLGGAIGRYATQEKIRRVRSDGTTSLRADLGALPQPTGSASAMAGDTWNFQAWFRDANPNVTSNFTDAVAVTLN